MPASSRRRARPIAASTSGEALMRRPCSSHVYHVTETPASIATSSRRNPGVRRWPPPRGNPTCSGVTASRRARKNSASSARWSIATSRPHGRCGRQLGYVERVDELLHDLERLVNVESPSHDIAALRRSAAVLSDVIEQRIGTPPAIVDGPDGPHVHWSGGGEPRVLI